MTEPFVPPFPVPQRRKMPPLRRFVTGWNSWIHTLFEKSYTMKLGDVALRRFDLFVANDPEIVEQVLDDRNDAYPKHAFMRQLLDPLLGNSMLVSNGEEWRDQRAMINPGFAHTALNRSFPVMREAVDDLIARTLGQDLSRPIAVDPLMTHVAADIIFRTLFSTVLTEAAAREIHGSFHAFQKLMQPAGLLWIYGLPLFGYRRRARRAAARIHALFVPIIERRFRAFHAGDADQPDDILASLLAARHPTTGEPFTVPELTDHIATIFFAGHETAASAMGWALYLLAEVPEWQDAIRAEVAEAAGEAPITAAHVKGFAAARAVFQETLRLYPPISFLLREVLTPTRFRTKLARPGSLMVVSPWLLQRNANHWQCPHGFDPDRFNRADQKEACRHAYLPFGRGPRICMGAGFAQQEGILTLASFVRAFRLEPVAGDKPEPVSRLTTRAKAGIRLKLTALSPA
jgi:cytochrome P450